MRARRFDALLGLLGAALAGAAVAGCDDGSDGTLVIVSGAGGGGGNAGVFVGNPELDRTRIDSFDLRWEWYLSADETISVGVFYKDLTDPWSNLFGSKVPFAQDHAVTERHEVDRAIGLNLGGEF